MGKEYSNEFKIEAVRRVGENGKTAAAVAEELNINKGTFYTWISKFQKHPEKPFPGSGNLRPEEDRLRKLERENIDLKEENEILKKAAAYFAKNQK